VCLATHAQLDEDGESGHAPLSEKTLTSEATLAIVAGSHKTAASLGHALFYLLAYPDELAVLRAELDDAALSPEAAAVIGAQVEDIPLDKLEKLPFLNAVMYVPHVKCRMHAHVQNRNETLRLRPQIPDGVPRTPPPSGGAVAVGPWCIIFLFEGSMASLTSPSASSPWVQPCRSPPGPVRPWFASSVRAHERRSTT
jgi:hypothetical protein